MVYGYPFYAACRVALAATRETLLQARRIEEAFLVCSSRGDFARYMEIVGEAL